MKILIVEDQEEKLRQVEDFFAETRPQCTLTVARSFQQAKTQLRGDQFDLVVLDMSLPMYPDGENLQSSVLVYGGEDLLAWAKLRIKNLRVIVLTQFDYFASGDNPRDLSKLSVTLKSDFKNTVLNVIHYQESDATWREILSTSLRGMGV
ncbi:response regulator [Burkholderia sp. Ac-20379]|uniref:response regulator n=1 Tax=Burkholderia sp. Ac-20379 TaxID=2703900 RepID=UPI00197D22EC|nr:response regulator [Burkholderia sp. Ac-20379]MBN3725517.1 hypothetical protein [Burkholderia sp. Ac-20379]